MRLYADDAAPDREHPAKAVLEPGCGGEMIGVDVRFKQPVDRQAFGFDIGGDLLSRMLCDRAGGGIVIEDAVEDGGAFRRWIVHDVTGGGCRFVEEGANDRSSLHARSNVLHDFDSSFDGEVVSHGLSRDARRRSAAHPCAAAGRHE